MDATPPSAPATPAVSVIVPVYKTEKYLAECIESILAQTFKDFEMILVDDGSPDNSGKICDDYAARDPRIRVFHKENGGVSSARNLGLDQARGEWIAFVDSDDTIPQTSIKEMFQITKKITSIDLVFGNLSPMQNPLKHISKPSLINHTNEKLWSGDTLLIRSIEDHRGLDSVCGKLFSRRIIQNMYFEKKVNEDVFFIFQIALKSPVVFVSSKISYLIRATPNSASREIFSEKYFDIFHIADKKISLIRKLRPKYEIFCPSIKLKAYLSMLWILLRNNSARTKKLERACIHNVRKFNSVLPDWPKQQKRWRWIVALPLGYYTYKFLFQKKRYLLGKINSLFAT